MVIVVSRYSGVIVCSRYSSVTSPQLRDVIDYVMYRNRSDRVDNISSADNTDLKSYSPPLFPITEVQKLISYNNVRGCNKTF